MKIQLSRHLTDRGIRPARPVGSDGRDEDLSVMRLIAGLGLLGLGAAIVYGLVVSGMEVVGGPSGAVDWTIITLPVPFLILWRAYLLRRWACVTTCILAWGAAVSGLVAYGTVIHSGIDAIPFLFPAVVGVLYTNACLRAWHELRSGW